MAKIKQIWIDLRSSLWFTPSVIVFANLVLAYGAIEIDREMHQILVQRWPRLFASEPSGSRAMLSAIASSIITLAGVVFSITIVTLALASNQFSPRVLRNYMRDRANQVVLGFFVGLFAYSLVVLRNISERPHETFVPSLAIFISFLLALAGIGFLIFFIHHVATMIQASEIAASIASETIGAIDKIYPQKVSNNERDLRTVCTDDEVLGKALWHPVPSRSLGFIQSIDAQALLNCAGEHEVVLRVDCGVGEFVVEGCKIVSVFGEKRPDEHFIRQINRAFSVGSYRTVDQDAAFGVRQLVDIALKALSPGINDATTAVTCVNYLSAILVRLADRNMDATWYLEGNKKQLIIKQQDFSNLVRLAFIQIIENAQGNTSVIEAMLSSIERISEMITEPSRQHVLNELISSLRTLTEKTVVSHDVRQKLEERIVCVQQLVKSRSMGVC